jgi:hypothetical protein
LTFELGELDYTDHPSFSLDDLAFWAGEGLRYDYSRFDLESASGLAAFVGTVARFVEVQADSILRNWTASANALSAKQLEREKLLDS